MPTENVHVLATVDVSGWAREFLVSDDQIWLPLWQEGRVARVSTIDGELLGSTEVGAWPKKPVRAGSYVWVPNLVSGTITRLDPVSGEVVDEIATGAETVILASHDESVWAVVTGQRDPARAGLVELDVTTGAEVKRVAMPTMSGPTLLRSEAGAVWVSGIDGTTLTRVDPESGSVVVVDVGQTEAAERSVVAFGSVWVPSRGRLSRIDPVTGSVAATPPVSSDGNWVTNLVSAFGSIWATTAHGEELWRVDPDTNEAERIGRGNGEGFVVAAGDYIAASHLWGVSFYSGRTGDLARTVEFEAGLPHGRNAVEGLGRFWLSDLTAEQLLVVDLASLDESVMDLGPVTGGDPNGSVSWTTEARDSLWTHTAGLLIRIGSYE